MGDPEPNNIVEPNLAGRKSGEQWFDTKTNKLYLHDGSNFKLAGYGGEVTNEFLLNATVGSHIFGTKLKTIFLNDNTGKPTCCISLVHVNDQQVPKRIEVLAVKLLCLSSTMTKHLH